MSHQSTAGRIKGYLIVFTVLLVLTLLTVFTSTDVFQKNLVPLPQAVHFTVAMVIATSKATMVALIFMHLRHSSTLTWLTAASALFFLALLIGLTMIDYSTRVVNQVGPVYISR